MPKCVNSSGSLVFMDRAAGPNSCAYLRWWFWFGGDDGNNDSVGVYCIGDGGSCANCGSEHIWVKGWFLMIISSRRLSPGRLQLRVPPALLIILLCCSPWMPLFYCLQVCTIRFSACIESTRIRFRPRSATHPRARALLHVAKLQNGERTTLSLH